jgi:hypothetical protein
MPVEKFFEPDYEPAPVLINAGFLTGGAGSPDPIFAAPA